MSIRKSPGRSIFTVAIGDEKVKILRACWSHSGRRPRFGRTSGGRAVDWLGVHLSLRTEYPYRNLIFTREPVPYNPEEGS